MDIDKMSMDELSEAYTQIQIENDAKEKAIKSLSEYAQLKSKEIASLTIDPGSVIYTNGNPYDEWSQMTFPNLTTTAVPAPSNVVYHTGTGMLAGVPPTLRGSPDMSLKERQDKDKGLQMKLFIHFAQLFVAKFPKWSLEPEPDDPLHKVRLINRDLGASIINTWPDNTVVVLGGPIGWTKQYMEQMSNLPIALVVTQEFFGWALDINVPEWVK